MFIPRNCGCGTACAETQKIVHPKQTDYQQAVAQIAPAFESPGQPVVSRLSKKDVLDWLLVLNDIELLDCVEQVLQQRPSLWKLVATPKVFESEIIQQNGQSEAVFASNGIEQKNACEQKVQNGETSPAADANEKENGEVRYSSEMSKISEELPMCYHSSMETNDHIDISAFTRPELPTVQFSSPMYYGKESDGQVEISLLRVGPTKMINGQQAVVHWYTEDGSAKAGLKYEFASGKAEFKPGEAHSKFTVPLIDNDDWDPTLDFYVKLMDGGLENVDLHRYHMSARVKIIDNDAFPTNRYQAEIEAGNIRKIPPLLLMKEYFKMNFKNHNIFSGSIKWLLLDAFESLIYLFLLTARVWMINELLMPVIKGEKEWNAYRKSQLIILALCFVIPKHITHFLHFRKEFWHVGGGSKKLLQANLMRKYMAYSPESLAEVDHGLIILALFKEIPLLVEKAYMAMFHLIKDLGLLVVILVYQSVAVSVMGLKTAEVHWMLANVGVVFFFPCVMIITFHIRRHKGHKLGAVRKDTEVASTSYTIDTLNNFFLLADYGKRGAAMQKFEELVDEFNHAHVAHEAYCLNNSFIPHSLTLVLCGCWIMIGSAFVVNGELGMGTFLANWSIFQQIGHAWAGIYSRWLSIHECFTSLLVIVRLMNLPVALENELAYTQECSRRGDEICRTIDLHPEDIACDLIPIKTVGLAHRFPTASVFSGVTLTLAQGKLHILAGRRATGKSTLLSLIGSRLVKHADTEGSLLVPAHLRVLHVAQESCFFVGSLYENLTYGVASGDRDGRLERVVEICKSLNVMEETLAKITDDPDAKSQRWVEVLSRSDCHLLNLARGLVANPEVLCIHKPSLGMGPNTVPIVFKALKIYVRERGNVQNVERFFFRRPRTCVYTFSARGDEAYADEVHRPFENGLEPPSPAQVSISKTSASLDECA